MFEYQIYDGETVIGTVKAEKQGMFNLLRVCCRPLSGKPERIAMTSNGQQTDLGLCIPDGVDMTLVKRVRRTGHEDRTVRFSVLSEQNTKPAQEETIAEREVLENLPRAYIGETGELMFTAQDQSSSNPTGQWSEPMISE